MPPRKLILNCMLTDSVWECGELENVWRSDTLMWLFCFGGLGCRLGTCTWRASRGSRRVSWAEVSGRLQTPKSPPGSLVHQWCRKQRFRAWMNRAVASALASRKSLELSRWFLRAPGLEQLCARLLYPPLLVSWPRSDTWQRNEIELRMREGKSASTLSNFKGVLSGGDQAQTPKKIHCICLERIKSLLIHLRLLVGSGEMGSWEGVGSGRNIQNAANCPKNTALKNKN